MHQDEQLSRQPSSGTGSAQEQYPCCRDDTLHMSLQQLLCPSLIVVAHVCRSECCGAPFLWCLHSYDRTLSREHKKVRWLLPIMTRSCVFLAATAVVALALGGPAVGDTCVSLSNTVLGSHNVTFAHLPCASFALCCTACAHHNGRPSTLSDPSPVPGVSCFLDRLIASLSHLLPSFPSLRLPPLSLLGHVL